MVYGSGVEVRERDVQVESRVDVEGRPGAACATTSHSHVDVQVERHISKMHESRHYNTIVFIMGKHIEHRFE